MVEQLEDVEPVGALRRRGHPEQEAGPQMVQDAQVGGRASLVHLVDEDVVEGIGLNLVQPHRQRLDRREDEAAVQLSATAGELPEVGGRRAEDPLELGDGLVEDLFPVHHEEHSLGLGRADVEGREDGLAGARGGDDDGAGLAPGAEQIDLGQRLLLHGVGDDDGRRWGGRKLGWRWRSPGGAVPVDPVPRQRHRPGPLPLHGGLDLVDDVAVGQRGESQVPLVVAQQRRLGEVGAADDGSGRVLLPEQVALGVEALGGAVEQQDLDPGQVEQLVEGRW